MIGVKHLTPLQPQMPRTEAKKKSKRVRKLELAEKRASRPAKPKPLPQVCELCGETKKCLDAHMDWVHVEKVVVKVWPGEWLTVNRRRGLFHCPWCVDKMKPGESFKSLRSARQMKVSIFRAVLPGRG